MNLNLPPRVKTQQQTLRNVEEPMPIPLESVFFLEDGEKDSTRPNRYYFNFPGNWVTANNGENIIGLRSIKAEKCSKKLEFKIYIAKYTKDKEKEFRQKYPQFKTYHDIIENMIPTYAKMKDFKVVCWLTQNTNDYEILFKTVHNTFKTYLSTWWGTTDTFKQSDDDPLDRDIQFEGYYDNNGYHIRLYSERNSNTHDDYNVCFRIVGINNDFKELFNANNLTKEWQKEFIFDNVWDLHSCNVYSSIAEQTAHHYIGTTDIEYHTIKYFKLNSADQRFWLEFCAMGNKNTPMYFPPGMSFRIEIQFLSFNKILNV